MVRLVHLVGAEVVVNHLVELHRLLVAEGRQAMGRQAIPGTLEEMVRPEVLPEEAVMATAIIMVKVMGNERVRTRRNLMAKVLKVRRKKKTQR